ncbi:TIGR02530 family flagellar biosynthesis protein [Thermatribacter velox]|uniref:TIGR02530 family flagellar biosynthesis protein n=1 Tax=Thermatribacter velox TaxID=3039681 RepID=A0ABZ2YDP4_9BACT
MVREIGFNDRWLTENITNKTPLSRVRNLQQGTSRFEKFLQEEEVRFSLHARRRIEERGISLDGKTTERLQEGISRAAAKGSQTSLVIVDGVGFVVRVPEKTVLTCMEASQEKVFTNIDSAVII